MADGSAARRCLPDAAGAVGCIFVSHWSAQTDAEKAEAELEARAARGAAAVRGLLDKQQRLLALVAAQPQWRAALTEPDAGAQVALSIRRAWAGAPAPAWVSEHGRVVVAGGAGSTSRARPAAQRRAGRCQDRPRCTPIRTTTFITARAPVSSSA